VGGDDDRLLHAVNGWNAGPVDVETGHRGGVRDPEGGTDRPADALVGERRGRSVPTPLPAAVDDAVEDQPVMVSGRRRRRISPPWSGRRQRRLAQLQTGIPRRRDTFAVGRGLSPAASRTSFHDVGGIEERANAGGKRGPWSRRGDRGSTAGCGLSMRCPPPPERERGKCTRGQTLKPRSRIRVAHPHAKCHFCPLEFCSAHPTPLEYSFCTRQSSLKIRKLLRK
jgi:hypothetical protein